MRRLGIITTCLIVLLLITATNVSAVKGTSTGVFEKPDTKLDENRGLRGTSVDTIKLCLGETYFDTLEFDLQDPGDTLVSLELFSGPGNLSFEVSDKIYAYYNYAPVVDGSFYIELLFLRPDADSSLEVVNYLAYVNEPPVIEDQYYSARFCGTDELRYRKVYAWDPESAEITFELVSGIGELDPVSGWLTYMPDTAGVYRFEIAVHDSCFSDTGVVHDTIALNTLPVLLTSDTTLYVCNSDEICFDVLMQDVDGDSIIANLLVGPGDLEFINDSTGQICFQPAAVDSARYKFLITLFDDCVPYGTGAQRVPRWSYDSIFVTVITDKAPTLFCPEEQVFYTCEPDTFCFEVDAFDPELLPVTFTVLSGNATIEGNTVCVVGDSSAQYDLMIAATDQCGNSDTCVVPVTIHGNRAPYVISADDFSLTLCNPEVVCFAVTVDDLDFDIVDVTVNYGTYDDVTDRVCFNADTSGTYVIVTTATDSCGITDSDTTVVTVNVSEAPVIELPDDFTTYLCEPTQICMDVVIIGEDIVQFTAWPPATFNAVTQKLCFIPDTAGTYELILEAVGECNGGVVRDTVNVTVLYFPTAFVDLGGDFSVNLCAPGEICVEVSTIDALVTLETNLGQYNEATGEICFLPDTAGVYQLIATVSDSCDATVADTVNITVGLNNPPMISGLSDTSLTVCLPTTVCLDVAVTDPDNDIVSISSSLGTYDSGELCFEPTISGLYELVLAVEDSCGNTVVDTALVNITAAETIDLQCPSDTTVFTCSAVDTFCFPVEGIPEGAYVQLAGINTWYDEENSLICFWSECSNTNRIAINVTTPCGSASCLFTVTVVCNSTPLVILPPDTSVFACQSEQYCFPVGISDNNGNLQSITVTGAQFNPITSRVCFEPDTAGIYAITVTATDSCGATDSDQMFVTVTTNSAPEVDVTTYDTVYVQCEPEEICLPVNVTDIDGNVETVYAVGATYNASTSEVCVLPTGDGELCGQVIAVDSCGLADTADFCITVETGDFVQIECPAEPFEINLCVPGLVCVPLVINGTNFQFTTSFGTWENNELCFTADTAGSYEIEIVGTAPCNVDTCVVAAQVTIAEPVLIACPNDTSLTLCGPDTVCFDFTASGPIDSISASGAAFIEGQTVCVPVLSEGEYSVTLTADGQCGSDSCSFVVTTTMNSDPVVTVSGIEPVTLCELEPICVPVTISDADNNIVEIISTQGSVSGDTLLCFTPPDFGTHTIIVSAVDACDAMAADTVSITVLAGGQTTILCPPSVVRDTICGPDSICVTAPVAPSGATVTVIPAGAYNPATGQVCIPVSETDTFEVMMIAEAQCGADTCEFTVQVYRPEGTLISCPEQIDTMLCLAEPVTFTFPISVAGHDVSVEVQPPATLSGDSVSLVIDQAGTYGVMVMAEGYCGVDTCVTLIVVAADQEPELFVPGFQTFERCLDDTSRICIDGISAMDAESTVVISQTCGVGTFDWLGGTDSAKVCFIPDTSGVYTFCFVATDGCHTVYDTVRVEILEKEDCELCVKLWLDSDSCTVVGVNKDVALYIETNDPIGGFDILLSYDAAVMSFNYATIEDTEVDGWEYFTYRLNDGACGGSCPSGLLRLVGIADMNNGASHPPPETLSPNGILVTLQFYIVNDQNLGGQFLPINFVWYDCGDNSISDPTGNDLYIDLRIYNPEMIMVWDEADDAGYPSFSRPFGVGAPDVCLQPDTTKPTAIRCVEFIHGGICVTHPDSIDDRGDINLNGVAYEISDVVVFSNYFIFGLGAFTINMAGQIAATDVNADGLTLSVADLVYLIRVLIGDADPIPRLNPYEQKLELSTDDVGHRYEITTNAVADIGAAHFVYDIQGGARIEDVRATSAAGEMDVMWDVVDGQLKVLVLDIGTDYIMSGKHTVLEIPYHGDGGIRLRKAEIVDYNGRPYEVVSKQGLLPTDYLLEQNYPNPFNPVTTISFQLPFETDWRLSIYNVTGSLVRMYSGADAAGAIQLDWDGTSSTGALVASGVYFYRLEAGEFSDTKKMILLK